MPVQTARVISVVDDFGAASVPTAGAEYSVFLGVVDEETRATLGEWLADRFGDAVALIEECADADLCLVDREGLAAAADDVRSLRAEAEPVHVPVLFVTPPPAEAEAVPESATLASTNGGTSVDSGDLDGVPADLVDETITRPLRFPDLARRLRSLLRVRRLSLALRDRERRYRNLLDLLAEGVCLVEDGTIVTANDACCRLLDVAAPGSITDSQFTDFVADGDVDAVTSLLSTIADGDPASLSCTLVTPDGDSVPVDLAGAISDPGTPPRLQLVVRDQRALRHRDERIELLEDALHGARQGIAIADVTREDNPLIYVNKTFTEITGYSMSEVLGRNCRFLQGAETEPDAVAQMRTAIDAGEPATVRVRNYRTDGTMFWNQVHLVPLRDGTGTVTHYLGFQEDVTEQVRREQELERYHALVQAADDPIYTLDADGYVTDVNDAFCSLTGHDHADIVGAHASAVVDDRDVEAMEDLIQSALEDGDRPHSDEPNSTGQTAEIVVETADGDRRLCEVSIGFLPSEDAFRGTVGILRDVTEPRGREQRLAVLERVLRHNLRNKTNVVLSRIERLQADERLPDDLEAELGIVADAATDIIDLSEQARQFRDVLALQRKELGTVDVVPIVRDVVEENRSAHEGVTIETTLPESAHARVRGRLRFALDELLDNAISHTETESPRIRLAVTEHDDTVEIRIDDDGPGIPESERKVATRERERPLEHGSGLGLWLVRWTVEQSCGRIAFGDDEPDSLEAVDQSTKSDGSADGATVRMILPRAD